MKSFLESKESAQTYLKEIKLNEDDTSGRVHAFIIALLKEKIQTPDRKELGKLIKIPTYENKELGRYIGYGIIDGFDVVKGTNRKNSKVLFDLSEIYKELVNTLNKGKV